MGKMEVFREKAEQLLDAGFIPSDDKYLWYCEFDEDPDKMLCFVERYADNVSFLSDSTANLKRRARERRYIVTVKEDLGRSL